jgi:hypothetical protein
MTRRDVGGMGHSDFSKLCDAAGLIHNSSYNKDAAGWDVFVEFPLNSHLNILNIKTSQAIQCLTQVKSTDSNKKSVSVKLSNLKRFCDTPLPCFFFFAEYEKGINPTAIYLVHFDKDRIFDVLQRLRECEVHGENKLNKKTMTVKYDESHRIDIFDGIALKECIESYIPNGMGEYAKEKTQHLEELGYEENKYKMIFKLSEQTDYSSLVMASLGYENQINIKDIFSWDNRFGIGFPISELSADNAVITFSNVEPHSHGIISFDDECDTLSFSCDYYFSPIALNAPEELASYRVKCIYFDMLIGIKSNTTKIKLSSTSDEMDIYDMRDIALLIKMLSNADQPVSMILRNDSGSETRFKTKTPLVLNNYSKMEVEKTVNITFELIQIASYFQKEKMFKLSLDQLFAIEKDIKNLHGIIFQSNTNNIIKIQNKGFCENLDNSKEFCALIGISLFLPKFKLCIIVTIRGGFTQDNDSILFSNHRIKIESKFCEANLDLLKPKVKRDARRLAEKYESEEDIYFFDSLSPHLD